MSKLVQVMDVCKSYGTKEQQVVVFQHLTFEIAQGKKVVVTGESGSGKTTLLSILSGLDDIDSGSITIDTVCISHSNEELRAKFRLFNIGFIFQYHYLLQDFTALENVMLPLKMMNVPPKEVEARAKHILSKVGMSHRLTHIPSQMSGGECQRTAIARALVHNPLLVLADEPTGALDSNNSKIIRNLLHELVVEQKTTLILASHDRDFLEIADIHWHVSQDGMLSP